MRRAERSGGSRLCTLVWLIVLWPAAAGGYEPQVHQRLTFHAAKLLNRCVQGTEVAPLTPLQVRLIATSNMGLANSNALVRFFRWSYFDWSHFDHADEAAHGDRRLLWLINTRFLQHFEEVADQVSSTADASERYRELGRIVGYVQLVTSPSRAVPVYGARFWRGSFGDRFDSYRVSERALERLLAERCDFLDAPPAGYREILYQVAVDTVRAVRSPIPGLPATWEAFWQPGAAAGDFGDYGPAGNSFGRQVEFPCGGEEGGEGADDGGHRCVLLDDDPLYLEFAAERQRQAILGTARAMYHHQRLHGHGDAEVAGAPPGYQPPAGQNPASLLSSE